MINISEFKKAIENNKDLGSTDGTGKLDLECIKFEKINESSKDNEADIIIGFKNEENVSVYFEICEKIKSAVNPQKKENEIIAISTYVIRDKEIDFDMINDNEGFPVYAAAEFNSDTKHEDVVEFLENAIYDLNTDIEECTEHETMEDFLKAILDSIFIEKPKNIIDEVQSATIFTTKSNLSFVLKKDKDCFILSTKVLVRKTSETGIGESSYLPYVDRTFEIQEFKFPYENLPAAVNKGIESICESVSMNDIRVSIVSRNRNFAYHIGAWV